MDCDAEDRICGDVRQRVCRSISETEYRVVHLLPGKFVDEIQCVLETRSFGIKSRYEALSYQWGDESVTKPIRIAQFDSSSARTSGMRAKALPGGVTIFLGKISGVLHQVGKRYAVALRILGWILGTCVLWRLLQPCPFRSSWWITPFNPLDICMALLCILGGDAVRRFSVNAIELMIEIAEIRPWLWVMDLRIEGKQSLEFETLQVTTNLDLALRHLRKTNRARTLWIDALCINQENQHEKSVQMQRMQWIYANALSVVVWLGGYHGLEEVAQCGPSSSKEKMDCEHQREIQAAFGYIRAWGGWRVLFCWFYNQNEEEHFQKSRAGLSDIARRGWWERLWVIQEVALATGRVQIQCGHDTCGFGELARAQSYIVSEHSRDKQLIEDFQSSANLRATIRDFRHSPFDDRGGIIDNILSRLLMRKVVGVLPHVSGDITRFQDLPFPHRLHRVLLRTAGRFSCRDDRDRINAVLGIVGSVETNKVTKMASFMETVSGDYTRTWIITPINVLWDSLSIPMKVAAIFFSILNSLWEKFYDANAENRSISQPECATVEEKEVTGALTNEPEEQIYQVDFLTAIAVYLANETKSLAFLSAANCGEDENEETPSWVPNWARVVSKPAYDFAIRNKEDPVLDSFEFINGGKTLQISGLPRGEVNVLEPADLDFLQSSPWHGAFEKVLALPSRWKIVLASALELIGLMMCQKSTSELQEYEKKLISTSVNLIKDCLGMGLALLETALLKEGGMTLIYSYESHNWDMRTHDLVYLRNGEADNGDQLVFVPGCFHHLILREREGTMIEELARWKIVGLVDMTTTTTPRRDYSKSEWAKLLRNAAVKNYSIE